MDDHGPDLAGWPKDNQSKYPPGTVITWTWMMGDHTMTKIETNDTIGCENHISDQRTHDDIQKADFVRRRTI